MDSLPSDFSRYSRKLFYITEKKTITFCDLEFTLDLIMIKEKRPVAESMRENWPSGIL